MRYYLLTLGCAKNVADSDGIGAILRQAGWSPTDRAHAADVLLVNTCGFLQAARKESLAALRDLAARKRAGQSLIAIGCLVSRYGETIRRQVPQVDAVLDAGGWLTLPRVIEQLRTSRKFSNLWEEERAARSIIERLPRAPLGPAAYLKIADGCDRLCAFCTIPAIKGAQHSKPPDAVIAEARDLVAHGVKEIVLVAQDTTAYGWDLGERDALASLVERLCREVEGLLWLRLMYAFPGHITPRLVEAMARYPPIVHYLDVPLQHAHPQTLERMRRPSLTVTRQTLDALRAAMPDLALRTTFIVGFPGETEEEFRALLDFLAEQRFDRVGVFEFSREEGTPAATMPGQVAAKTKKRRRDRAMALQQKISLAKNQLWLGKELDVLIEGVGGRVSIARSYRDAPEVDGVVIIPRELPVGEFVRVRVTQAMEYDLVGEPVMPLPRATTPSPSSPPPRRAPRPAAP